MGLQVEICNDINEKEWNFVVYNSKHGSIFHTLEWVDLLETEYGKRILIEARLNEKLVGVFPCIVTFMDKYTKHIRSFKLGYDHGGPISIDDNPQIIKEMLFRFDELAKNEVNKATIVTPFNWNFESELEKIGFSKSLETSFIVDLKKPVSELWRNLSKSARKNVKKALKMGLSVRSAKERSEIEKYYEIFVKSINRAGLDPSSRTKSFYYNLWDNLYEKGLAKILLVEFNKEIIAGMVLLLFKKTLTQFCCGTLPEYRSYQPNSLLNWHIIEWGNKKGFEYFDFAGATRIPNLYRYKKKWGGNLTNYSFLTKTYLSKKHKLLKSYYRICRSLDKLKKFLLKY